MRESEREIERERNERERERNKKIQTSARGILFILPKKISLPLLPNNNTTCQQKKAVVSAIPLLLIQKRARFPLLRCRSFTKKSGFFYVTKHSVFSSSSSDLSLLPPFNSPRLTGHERERVLLCVKERERDNTLFGSPKMTREKEKRKDPRMKGRKNGSRFLREGLCSALFARSLLSFASFAPSSPPNQLSVRRSKTKRN